MPDRYGENANGTPYGREDARRLAAINASIAVRNCDLCDEDGYLGSAVCDHTDHRDAARRGMNLIRATMGWKAKR